MTTEAEKQREPNVKGCQISPTAQAVPYQGWQQGATIAISPPTPRGVRGALEVRSVRGQVRQKVQPVRGCTPKRPPQGTRRTRTELQEEETKASNSSLK